MTTTKAKPGPWADEENAGCISLYFEMLDAATLGAEYNKAAMIRATQGKVFTDPDAVSLAPAPLKVRSRGSIEAKLMNCSAAHRDVSAESGGQAVTMDGYGYRALSNYQGKLKAAMAEGLKRRELQGQVA